VGVTEVNTATPVDLLAIIDEAVTIDSSALEEGWFE
jgi:hypothetical protein